MDLSATGVQYLSMSSVISSQIPTTSLSKTPTVTATIPAAANFPPSLASSTTTFTRSTSVKIYEAALRLLDQEERSLIEQHVGTGVDIAIRVMHDAASKEKEERHDKRWSLLTRRKAEMIVW